MYKCISLPHETPVFLPIIFPPAKFTFPIDESMVPVFQDCFKVPLGESIPIVTIYDHLKTVLNDTPTTVSEQKERNCNKYKFAVDIIHRIIKKRVQISSPLELMFLFSSLNMLHTKNPDYHKLDTSLTLLQLTALFQFGDHLLKDGQTWPQEFFLELFQEIKTIPTFYCLLYTSPSPRA